MMALASQRAARILAGARHEIDEFLDSSVLTLVDHELGSTGTRVQRPVPEPAPEADAGAPLLEVLELRGKVVALQAQVESLLSRAEAARDEAARSEARAAAECEQLSAECDRLRHERGQALEASRRLEEEKRAERRKAEDADQKRLALEEGLGQEYKAERRRLQGEVERLRGELAAATSPSAAPGVPEGSPAEEALRQRIVELEREGESLRLLLEQGEPERRLSAQLRQRHTEYQEELRVSREARRDLQAARARNAELEQRISSLEGALRVRDAALQEADEAARGASLARRDLAAFAAVASVIVSEAEVAAEAEPASAPAGGGAAGGVQPTPLDLTHAWARFQREVRALRRKEGELKQAVERTAEKERQQQAELARLGAELAAAGARGRDQEREIGRLQADRGVLAARAAVLREAILQGADGHPGTGTAAVAAADVEEGSQAALKAATERVHALEEAAKDRDAALGKALEAATLGGRERERLSEAEARAAQLECVNAELAKSNKLLERQREASVAALERLRGGAPLFDPESDAATGDSEQTRRQLDCLRRAMRKYVQEFQEGIFHLVGWKVSMHQEGKTLAFTVMPSVEGERKLKFTLSPAAEGCPSRLDLLDTAWAQELQNDRKAMVFLEVHRSVPCFLAHLTRELLSKQSNRG